METPNWNLEFSRLNLPTGCRQKQPRHSTSRGNQNTFATCTERESQARQMLIARRLVERGVRFVQLWHGAGQPWDNHDDIEVNHRRLALQCDQAIGALLTDLKQRGLLEDTLVIWGGEFGRTPTVELPKEGLNAGKINGRDHNHWGFTTWLAGGGVRGGYVHGATDDFGFKAVEDKVHVHDLHATMLKLIGFRSRDIHLPLRRPRFPPDRRPRSSDPGTHRIVPFNLLSRPHLGKIPNSVLRSRLARPIVLRRNSARSPLIFPRPCGVDCSDSGPAPASFSDVCSRWTIHLTPLRWERPSVSSLGSLRLLACKRPKS